MAWRLAMSHIWGCTPATISSTRAKAAPGRFGAHQFQEFMQDTLVYCAWFAGGLRVVAMVVGTRIVPAHGMGKKGRKR